MSEAKHMIDTPFGKMELVVNSDKSLYLTSGYESSIVINGVHYRTSLHLERTGSPWTALHMYRGADQRHASESAKKRALAALPTAVNVWLDTHPEALRDGQRAHLEREIERAREAREEHSAKLREIADKIQALTDELAALG